MEVPSAKELAVINDASALIEKPVIQPRLSAGGRSYIPKLSQGTILRVTGLSQTQWKQIRQLVCSLFTAHKLDVLKEGKVVPWEQKNWRNKEAAFIALETQFCVLKQCVAHWAADTVFEAHFDYHRDKVFVQMMISRCDD